MRILAALARIPQSASLTAPFRQGSLTQTFAVRTTILADYKRCKFRVRIFDVYGVLQFFLIIPHIFSNLLNCSKARDR